MKLPSPLLRTLLLATALGIAGPAAAQQGTETGGKKAYHVVLIWLKQHGDADARQKYIEGSKRLGKLPGILQYNIGTPATIKREKTSPALDNSYDIAVSSTFESQQALENFLKDPEHHKVVQEVLRPLVDKYKVYDFAE